VTSPEPGRSLVGERYTLTLGALAHGGHCVARHEGRVVFVRHGVPGERVVARVTEGEDTSRFLRADAVEVLETSPDRVRPPCPVARPGGCGGCDFQHVAPAAQRRLLAGVVAEQLRRLAGLDVHVEVEPVPGDEHGLGWRTRVRFAADDQGRLGLRRHRSHEVVPLEDCPIAHPDLPPVLGHRWPGSTSVEAVASGSGDRLVVVEPSRRGLSDGFDASASNPSDTPVVSPDEADGVVTRSGRRLRGRTYVTEPASGRRYRVSGPGFWQVHPGAAEALTGAAVQMLDPQPGETALDLYAGVGLFAGALAPRVGRDGSVLAVEGQDRALRDARRNLHDLPQVRLLPGRVDRVLRGLVDEAQDDPAAGVDLVLLDPPRTGARRRVAQQVVALGPRAVCYVACDPAALARDVATFGEHGYALARLRAFDIFPMTHHVECVALLRPRNGATPAGVGR
jgi:tRNA/tmRNA/rRNA uracil-C5-methylase (TrmA/RlmC/RlmD family)